MKRFFKNKKENRGITLIALIVTIVVLLILAGISIASLTGNNGIIKNATEAQIQAALSEVREQLDLYKIHNEANKVNSGDYSGEMSNQELVGTIYSEAFMNDTYRNVGIIKASGIKDELKCGTKLGKSKQEESIQTQLDSGETANLDNIYQLYDVFVVDFADDTLYYVKNNQIWSIEGTKTDYTLADGSITQNYPVEQVDKAYLEKKKFITEWQVATGEQVVLPIWQGSKASYNCTIEWGDGTTTLLQDNVTVDGEKKTNYVEVDGQVQTITKLSEAVTHTYTTDSTNNIREIKISGVYEDFHVGNITTEQKGKLVEIRQWGNIALEVINLQNCTNLTGSILAPNVEGTFSSVTSFISTFSGCSGLTGEIPENLFANCTQVTNFASVFNGCSGLTGEIPENLFANCTQVTNFANTFNGCSGLTGEVPENLFANCTQVTSFENTFNVCTGLTGKIPENLFANCTQVTNFGGTFGNCSNFNEIPEKLFSNCKEATNFNSTFGGLKITSIPENLFKYNTKANSFNNTFKGCSSLTSIPENLFYNCATNANFGGTWNGAFMGCTSLTEIPAGLFSKQTECTSIGGIFSGCTGITRIPANLFENNTKVTNFSNAFSNTSITEIPENLFANCPEVTEFLRTFMYTKITSIPVNLFANNTKVTNFGGTFYHCNNIQSIPAGLLDNNTVVTEMGTMFYACYGLKEIEEGFKLPQSVKSIASIFADGPLTVIPENFEIGENVTNSNWAFGNCRSLSGSILVNSTPTNYDRMFSNTSTNAGSTLTVNYTSNCTNIDDLIATKGSGNVVKGSLIE